MRAALWYFRDEIIATPKASASAASFTRGMRPYEDVRTWYLSAGEQALAARPQLAWVAAPLLARDARLDATGTAVAPAGGPALPFRVTPKIPTNQSYYDASSVRFFGQRSLRIRGSLVSEGDGTQAFVGRTLWPRDYAIRTPPRAAPLQPGETLLSLARESSASQQFEVRLLWERSPGAGRERGRVPVLGIVLNGAQGDDDEALGGHFAIATGYLDASGDWADWMTNNFYTLDRYSEKGIIASMLPMDNYLMDLNGGQAYYRPSDMLVAFLKEERAAAAYQAAVARVFHHFYRHDLLYSHAQANCAGLSLDTFHAVGWNIPPAGATSHLKALLAWPYVSLRERSLSSGRSACQYYCAERTRLLPAMAFEAAGTDLMRLTAALAEPRRPSGRYESWLASDVEAIAFVHIPQIPSSRVLGSFAVASLDEYLARTPKDRSEWRTIPTRPRPFPAELAD